jgi:paired amphipathic helix protein Sin3a
VAVELGINDNSWSAAAAVPKNNMGQETNSDHFYQFLLSCVEKLFDGELEQSAFEDCARVTFGTLAYKLFTIDKVIVALNKQVSLPYYRMRLSNGCLIPIGSL